MSYILEGLKKLEKNRQQAATPGLFTTYNSAPPARDKSKWRRYIMVAALMVVLFTVGAGGALWWFSGATSGTPALHPGERTAAAEPEIQPLPAVQPAMVQAQQKPLDPPLVEKQEELIREREKETRKSSRRKSAPADEAEAFDADGAESAQKMATGEKIISFKQLPEDVKKSLPEMKVFMHYYSPEKKERFVQINEHTLREGQSRPDGLKVLQITEHVAIFSYQGHKFQIRAIEK